MANEIIYTEHIAGTFEDGVQVCNLCGHPICDYNELYDNLWCISDKKLVGLSEGQKVWITGINPVETTTIKPKENYGKEDPYTRKIISCVNIEEVKAKINQ